MKTLLRNTQWADKYPDLGKGPVPAEPCISPEYFELERDRVFRRTWVNLCRIDDVPKPGSFFKKSKGLVLGLPGAAELGAPSGDSVSGS